MVYLDIVRDTVCSLTLRTREHAVKGEAGEHKHPLNIGEQIIVGDWPFIGITMLGQKRLINIEWALRYVIGNNIPADFIECGVWRGGGLLCARAALKALNIEDRYVWSADLFERLPKAYL